MSNLILLSLLISGTGAVPLIRLHRRRPHGRPFFCHPIYAGGAFPAFYPILFVSSAFFPILFRFIGTISYTLSASFYALCNHDTSE